MEPKIWQFLELGYGFIWLFSNTQLILYGKCMHLSLWSLRCCHNGIDAFGNNLSGLCSCGFSCISCSLSSHTALYSIILSLSCRVLFVQKNSKYSTLGYYSMFKFSNLVLRLFSQLKPLKFLDYYFLDFIIPVPLILSLGLAVNSGSNSRL